MTNRWPLEDEKIPQFFPRQTSIESIDIRCKQNAINDYPMNNNIVISIKHISGIYFYQSQYLKNNDKINS
jgi:hypothetical protein